MSPTRRRRQSKKRPPLSDDLAVVHHVTGRTRGLNLAGLVCRRDGDEELSVVPQAVVSAGRGRRHTRALLKLELRDPRRGARAALALERRVGRRVVIGFGLRLDLPSGALNDVITAARLPRPGRRPQAPGAEGRLRFVVSLGPRRRPLQSSDVPVSLYLLGVPRLARSLWDDYLEWHAFACHSVWHIRWKRPKLVWTTCHGPCDDPDEACSCRRVGKPQWCADLRTCWCND